MIPLKKYIFMCVNRNDQSIDMGDGYTNIL